MSLHLAAARGGDAFPGDQGCWDAAWPLAGQRWSKCGLAELPIRPFPLNGAKRRYSACSRVLLLGAGLPRPADGRLEATLASFLLSFLIVELVQFPLTIFVRENAPRTRRKLAPATSISADIMSCRYGSKKHDSIHLVAGSACSRGPSSLPLDQREAGSSRRMLLYPGANDWQGRVPWALTGSTC